MKFIHAWDLSGNNFLIFVKGPHPLPEKAQAFQVFRVVGGMKCVWRQSDGKSMSQMPTYNEAIVVSVFALQSNICTDPFEL